MVSTYSRVAFPIKHVASMYFVSRVIRNEFSIVRFRFGSDYVSRCGTTGTTSASPLAETLNQKRLICFGKF